MSQIISRVQLKAMIDELANSDVLVAAPVAVDRGPCFFQYVQDAREVVLDPRAALGNTIKEFFFPRCEVLYNFTRHENDIELTDAPLFEKQQVIFGARPCDAASLPILDPLFAWDYQDRFYQKRRENSTIVSFACVESDSHCFCSDVGGSPDNPSGADVLLFDLGDDTFEVRCVTEQGKRLFQGRTTESDKTGQACDAPVQSLDIAAVGAWIDTHFNDSFWEDASYRCVGCGVCTYVCPTCHCFDIVDEGSFSKGKRVKTWDSCQSALFTLHASGHNPRSTQGQRQRQRISHKFSIYPSKFGMVLCTGCGNCTRLCGTSLGVKPMLDAIAKKNQ